MVVKYRAADELYESEVDPTCILSNGYIDKTRLKFHLSLGVKTIHYKRVKFHSYRVNFDSEKSEILLCHSKRVNFFLCLLKFSLFTRKRVTRGISL